MRLGEPNETAAREMFRMSKRAACLLAIALSASCVVMESAAAASSGESEVRAWPQAPLPKVRQFIGVKIPMRDGVQLATDIWLPQGAGRYPVVLLRTPYEKSGDFYVPDRILKLAHAWAAHGIGIVHQDVRGRGDSEGEFELFFNEGEDGHDTIEWIATQPWSNGQVAMTDGSYKGTVQWLAARERPPHLTCLFSQAAAADFFNEIPYSGGAFNNAWTLDWPLRTTGRTSLNAVADSRFDLSEVLKHRPLIDADLLRGTELKIRRQILQHPTLDDWWKRIFFTDDDFRKVDIPAFHVSGWFDGQLRGQMVYWRGMQAHSPARDRQYLMLGPWTHGETRTGGSSKLGDVDRGSSSVVDIDALQLQWFKSCFAGTTDKFDWPRARVFLTGANTWLDFDDFTPRRANEQRFYLHSDGTANQTKGGRGRLAPKPPGRQPFDAYAFDPTNPVTTVLKVGEVREPGAVPPRDDVLVYTSEAFTEPLAVLGPVSLVLQVATSARDTDFVAHLHDVDDAGRARRVVLKTAILRTRYREGFEKQVLMKPGVPTRIELQFFDVGHVFLPGHRLQIELSSSTPSANPNQNTGNDVGTDTRYTVAQQRVFHDTKLQSYLKLSVIPWPYSTDRE